MASRGPTLLDGGLGTSLQAMGLPMGVPADRWVLERPEAVVAAHASFARAGARVACTATLSVPSGRGDARAALLLRRAVTLARAGGAPEVWLSLGPGAGHAAAVEAVADAVDGVVLETFVEPGAALEAARAVRAVWDGALVVSVVPDPAGGARGGLGWPTFEDSLLALGVTGLGLNCMPADVVLAAARQLGRLPLWLKPSALRPQDATTPELWARASWFGGCCGTPPAAIEALAALTDQLTGGCRPA